MTTKKSTGDTFPTLILLANLACEREYDAVLRGICQREDAKANALLARAVLTFDHLTDNPKAAAWQAEAKGQMDAGEIPITSDILMKALLDRATHA